MGIIAAHNDVTFEPSDKLFSKVKRKLKSYNQAGLLDSNDFSESVMDVLSDLGIGGLVEEQAVLEVKDGRVHAPENFKTLYAAYICDAKGFSSDHPRFQGGYAFYTDTTYQDVAHRKCAIDCASTQCGTKVTVREYVQGLENLFNYEIKVPLHETTYSSYRCHPHDIAVYNNQFFLGFETGSIYVKYYAYPIDQNTGLPLVPNVKSIQKAIEQKIIYEAFMGWYLNDEVPDIERKMVLTKQLYDQAFSAASYEAKLPSFKTMVDLIRTKRQSLDIYRQTDSNT